ncbi:hypothetical protein WR25_11218 isoform A [Diploscapter pachys]|uniref:Heme oxygenase n=1 Tax=Diploscapter pachys TaxID=2018661 RepID=A0A2A2LU56_9BILA|nr:hypothetical protein WR25_11218 isoform A [Diploscapter pachys]
MTPTAHSDFQLPKRAIERLEKRLEPLRKKLEKHPLYAAVQSVDDLRYFMQNHVFAVWDFMSLLKVLQRHLTCVDIPWEPKGFRESRRLINEIVLGEESDFVGGQNISHLELYLDSMKYAKADTAVFEKFMHTICKSSDYTEKSLEAAFAEAKSPRPAAEFVKRTFEFIQSGKVHIVAAAFAFGREDLIPLMFTGLLRDMNKGLGGILDTFIVYLERHIEVDGEDHGPMSLRMMAEVCGGEEDPRWDEAIEAAVNALQARVDLWDGVVAELNKRKQ